MVKIQEDELGKFVDIGWICRPHPDRPSAFEVGTELQAHHFGGSRWVGVGKLAGKGLYKEYWMTHHTNDKVVPPFKAEKMDAYFIDRRIEPTQQKLQELNDKFKAV